MKAEEFIEKAIEKNMSYEYYTELVTDDYGCSLGMGHARLGINSNEYIWTWFLVLSDGTALANRVYSQRTGKTDKSYKRCFLQEDRILR